MNIGWNIESIISVTTTLFCTMGLIYIIRLNWKQYGLLFLLSAAVGEVLCILFMNLGFYSFPYRMFPHITTMPITVIVTIFPLYVLIGVRYSPSKWKYKIPFYWSIIHTGVLAEVLAGNFTKLIKYERYWDVWDTYTWWWIYLLTFQFVGGMIVSDKFKKPINEEALKIGRVGWFIVWFILLLTVFLAGLYTGIVTSGS